MLAALRRIGAHPWLEPHVSRGLRARLTTTPVRFYLRDLRGRGRYTYVVREAGDQVLLEHGTSDVPTLDQAFYQRVYEPAPGAARRLAEIDWGLKALDLGANIGLFCVWLARRFALDHVVAVEPVGRNLAALHKNLALTLPAGSYTVVAGAAGVADGPVSFGGGDAFTTGRVRRGPTPGAITVAGLDTFALLDGIDLLKLDIEGGEWPILQDPRFAELTVPVVMLEHHPAGAPGDAAAAADRLLGAAGYEVERTLDEGDGTGIVWGFRRAGAA